MATILRAEHVTKEFANGEKVLRGIDLAVEGGSFTVLLGPSGSGKSTLLGVLSGLLKPTTGKVWYGECEVSAMNEGALADWKRGEVGNIFQNYLLLTNLTARENIEIGTAPGRQALPFDALVDTLELGDLLDKFPAQLSGGQQQRVAIARAVIKKPGLLFCDEATGALDEANSKKVVGLLHSVRRQFGVSVLFVTHNLQIAETADRVITIKDGLLHRDIANENPIAAEKMEWGQAL